MGLKSEVLRRGLRSCSLQAITLSLDGRGEEASTPGTLGTRGLFASWCGTSDSAAATSTMVNAHRSAHEVQGTGPSPANIPSCVVFRTRGVWDLCFLLCKQGIITFTGTQLSGREI